MLKTLVLFVYVFFVSFSAFCMDGEYVRYESGIKSDLQPFMDQLKKNQLGLELLKKIDELYSRAGSKCSGIVFKRGSKTAFFPRSVEGKIELVVEIADFDDQLYPCLRNTNEGEYKAISAESTPFWITLAHELIHLKHKLEEVNGISRTDVQGIPYSLARTIGIEDILVGKYQNLFPLFPELSEWRLDMLELWLNLEERRTVIGPDIDGICEASIRLLAGFPTRFIYQDKSIKSLEETSTIVNSLNETSVSMAGSVPSVGIFCIEEDIVSRLTPIKVLLSKGISEEQIIKNADSVPITFITRKVFSLALGNSCAIKADSSIQGLLVRMLKYKPKLPVIDEW